MEYVYSSGELRDGPGHGVDVFQTAKQAAVKDTLLGGECYDTTKLQALGATPADFYDPSYVTNVGSNCAANTFNPDCTMGDAPKWKARWIQDRPALDPQGAPLLIFYGGNDTYVKPGWAECMRERFAQNLSAAGATTTVKICWDANATHNNIIRGADPDYVNQWIAARGGVGAEPSACTDFPTGMMCLVPPNDF
jgi:hypothetical protein